LTSPNLSAPYPLFFFTYSPLHLLFSSAQAATAAATATTSRRLPLSLRVTAASSPSHPSVSSSSAILLISISASSSLPFRSSVSLATVSASRFRPLMVVFRPDTSPPLRVLSIYCIGTPIHPFLSTAFSPYLIFIFSPSNRNPQAPRRGWPPILGLLKSGTLDEEWLMVMIS
ncbi:hypothetical protein LINGRAHAP2_LOCUS7699, partial [Linum grandiflorum]